MQFGTETYRDGAKERIEDARILLRNGEFSGSIYVAGLAVEGMLRSLIWLRDRRLDERHDLRKLAVRVADLGLLREGSADPDFVADAQAVSRSWVNDLRFAGDAQVQRWLRRIGVIRKEGRGGTTQRRERPLQPLSSVRETVQPGMGQTKITQRELKEVLERRMKLREPEFHLETQGAKISGSIVSDTFDDWDDARRQRAIWDALESEYGGESVQGVGVLFAYTRDEWSVKLD